MLLAIASFIGWQYWESNHSIPALKSTQKAAEENNEQIAEESSEVELTEAQKNEIAAHNEKMQSLTKVEPVPVAQVPNINQSLQLPELKSLTVNELTEPELNLNNSESIGSTGNAHAVSSSGESTVITNTTTPVIDTVSRQTGIPSQDIERRLISNRYKQLRILKLYMKTNPHLFRLMILSGLLSTTGVLAQTTLPETEPVDPTLMEELDVPHSRKEMFTVTEINQATESVSGLPEELPIDFLKNHR